MTKKLNGIASLAYMGANASSPPNVTYHTRPPTTRDWENFVIGDIWQVENDTYPTQDQHQIWTLVSLSLTNDDNRALWLRLTTTAGGAFDFFIITNPATGTATPTILGELTLTSTQNLTATAGGTAFQYDLKDDVVINNSLEVTALGGAVTQFATINSSGVLGTTAPTADGQVPIGKGSDGSFLWQTITAGTNVTVANGANSITISASGGVSAIDTIHNDSATDVVMDAADTSITINGGNVIEAIADSGDPANHTLLVQMTTTGTDGQIPISATGGSPAWASITGAGGITITPGANTIQVSGGGIGSTITFTLDDATTAVPVAGALNVLGGTGISGYSTNMHTYANPNGGTNLYVGLNDSINWPDTNATGTGNDTGVLQLGGSRFLHNYGTDNTWVGEAAGRRNASLTGSSNTGVGRQAGTNITSGDLNSFLGYQAGRFLTQGTHNTALGANALETLVGSSASSYGLYNVAVGAGALTALTNGTSGPPAVTANGNTAVGRNSLQALTQGNGNIALGINAGINYLTNERYNILIGNDGVVGEDNTIRIGEHGNSTGEQDTTYIAGIKPVPDTLTNDYNVVFINSDNQVVTNAATSAGQILYATNDSSAGGGTAWGFLASDDFNVSSSGSGVSINNRREGFFVYGGGDSSAVTGDNSTFWLGEGVTGGSTITNFTERYNSGNWSHPSGNYGRYTAPYTGMYFMQCTIYVTNVPPVAPPPPPAAIVDCPVYIEVMGTSANVYQSIDPVFGTSANSEESRNFSAFIKLTAGDTVRFGVQIDDGSGSKTIYTVNTTTLAGNAGIQWCSGHLVFRL